VGSLQIAQVPVPSRGLQRTSEAGGGNSASSRARPIFEGEQYRASGLTAPNALGVRCTASLPPGSACTAHFEPYQRSEYR
jgi:hypothetical protein